MQRRQAASARRRGGRASGAAPGRRPLPPGDTMVTPSAGPARRAVERRSAPLLVVMHGLPRLVVPLLMAALFGVGLVVAGLVGIAALVLLLAFVSWLSYLSWPAVDRKGRVVRLLLSGLLTGLVVAQLASR
jgi:hypothetical protein